MTIDSEDLKQVLDGVDAAIGARLEAVNGAIEQLREEFQQTVTVLDGSIMSVISHLQSEKQENEEVVGFMDDAGAAWERFVTTEAMHLGLLPAGFRDEVTFGPVTHVGIIMDDERPTPRVKQKPAAT